MKTLVTLILTGMMFFFLFVNREASAYGTPTIDQLDDHPNYYLTKTTWYGGAVGDQPAKIEGKTLDEIAERAFRETVFLGGPVQYRSEDGRIVYWAYPVFDKSKCEKVFQKAWQEGKLVLNKSQRVCLVNEMIR